MTQEQYDFIQERYGNLIYMIAQRISGDNATSEVEDNVQDLWLAAMDAIRWFESQDDGKNGKFEDFKESKGFHQYIKTCLWHRKGKKGTSITKKMHINHAFSIDGERSKDDDSLMLDLPDLKVTNYVYTMESLEDIRIKLPDQHKVVVSHILNHPDCLKEDGSVNVHGIVRSTNLKHKVVNSILTDIKNQYNLSLI